MTRYQIDIQNDDAYAVVDEALIRAIETVLSAHHIADETALCVVITDDADVQALNAQFRGIDAPTDILSFPADAPPIPMLDEPPYLGDLIIAYPYAKAQAERIGHDLGENMMLLVVHGVLHLLGYDHDTPEHKALMWSKQAEALQQLGISAEILPPLEEDTSGDVEA